MSRLPKLSILDTLLGSEIFTDHLEGFISKCYISISGGDDFSFCLNFLFWDDAAIRTVKGKVQPEYIFFLLLELLFIPLYRSGYGIILCRDVGLLSNSWHSIIHQYNSAAMSLSRNHDWVTQDNQPTSQ